MSVDLLTPDQALFLVTLGLLLLVWEGCRPGTVVPGAAGLAAVLTGSWLLSRHIPTARGLLGLVLGMCCSTVAIFAGRLTVLLPPAAVLLAAGWRLLFPGPFQIRWSASLGFILVWCLAVSPVLRLAWRGRQLKRGY